MRYFAIFIFILFLSACSTWKGVKKDARDTKDWSVEKINQGANYVKEKTD